MNRLTILNLLLVTVFCSMFVNACKSAGIVKPPSHDQNYIAAYKNLTVRANKPYPIKTGIIVKKGELYTIMVTGKVNTNPDHHPNRWQGPKRRLGMFVGNEYYGTAPANKTLESHLSGELMFYVQDAAFDFQKRRARDPYHYDNNIGRFNVSVLVWEGKDWDAIRNSLIKLKLLNPGNEAVENTLKQTDIFRKEYETQ